MNDSTIKQILALNTKFYQSVATHFSKTRQSNWKGWIRVVNFFEEVENPKVLDIGCGNGRFLNFLKENTTTKFEYTGIDNNAELLAEAQSKNPDFKFSNLDVFANLDSLKENYNFIVVFGLMHHIPGKEFREKWLCTVVGMLKENGILVLTFWDFKAEKVLKELPDEGDYILGWDKKPETERYAHKFTEKELNEISTNYDVELVEKFEADGKDNKSNKYLIFKKVAR